MILILAGSFIEAAHRADSLNLSHNRWWYLDHPDKLRGIVKPDVLRCGTYYMRRDIYDVEVELAYRQANFVTEVDVKTYIK